MSHPDHLLVLQSRWRPIDHDTTPSLLYYGVRNPPRQRRSLLPISAPLAALLDSAEHPLNPADQPPAMLGRLVADLQISQEEIRCAGDELSFSLAEWATGS